MPSFDIHPIDIAILLSYVLGTRIVLGWWFARKTKKQGAEGYFLAGRGMGWPIIGLSFYVANMSGSTFIALPGSGYLDGIAVYNYEWVPALLLVFFAVYLLPLFLRSKLYTAPQFLERRFGRSTQLAFAAFLLLANIFIDAAAGLYAGAMVAQVLAPEIPLWVIIATISLLAGLYIAFGGLGAVVYNDAIQAALIIGGGATISLLALQEVGSWEAVRSAAPEHALHLLRPADDDLMPWPGLFSGVLIIGFYFWCTNQFVIQRALAARSLAEGRKGALFAGLLKLPNLFLLIMPGVIAVALYPDLENPDSVFPVLTFDLLPIGLRGLMLAALAAAIFSSLEAILNSASTLFTMDFVKTLRPATSDRGLVWTGRIATLSFMVLAAVWAPQITHFPSLWQYLQSILAYVTPPVVVVFLLGLFWRRANAAGAFATLALGVSFGVMTWAGNEILGWLDIQFLYASGLMLSLSVAILVSVSLVSVRFGSRPPSGAQQDCCTRALIPWGKAAKAERAAHSDERWSRSERWLGLLLIALTLLMVVWWR